MKYQVALVGAAMFFLANCAAVAADRPKHELTGKPAPDFKLPLLGGGEVALSELKGKNVVLLDFWATWCPPCRKVMPTLESVAKKYESKGVRYLAVNLREDTDTIQGYLKKAGLDIEVPLDKDGKVAGMYKVTGIPTMAIVDKQGMIREVHVGATADLEAQLTKTLDQLVGP